MRIEVDLDFKSYRRIAALHILNGNEVIDAIDPSRYPLQNLESDAYGRLARAIWTEQKP